MKRAAVFAAVWVATSVLGCSKKSDTAAADGGAAASAEGIERAIDEASKGARNGDDDANANACLMAYASKYDELVPLALAAQHAGLPVGQAKTKYSRTLSDHAFQEVRYTWPSTRKRTITVGKMTVNAPAPNQVVVGSMKPMTREYFKRSYKPATAEGVAKLNEAIDESKEKGVDTKGKKDLAKDLGGMMAEITQHYRDVPGIGEAASFNTFEMRLYVLDRGVRLQITADLGADADANQAKAVAIAKSALARCP